MLNIKIHFTTNNLTNIFTPELTYPTYSRMNRKIILLGFILLCINGFAQRSNDQYSIEADFGLNTALDPSISGLKHFGVGFRYMVDDTWGLKIDYAHNGFRTGGDPEEGSDYNRFSVQGVYNVGRALELPYNTGDRINMLAHAGLGYSSLKSVQLPGIDNIGHIIVGITPQIYIVESVTLHGDLSYIHNFTQHFRFDGTYPPGHTGGRRPSFTSGMITASVGLTFYFGKNKSDSDWR